MAVIIGGTAAFPGLNNTLKGTGVADQIFGDPYTAGFVNSPPDLATLTLASGVPIASPVSVARTRSTVTPGQSKAPGKAVRISSMAVIAPTRSMEMPMR